MVGWFCIKFVRVAKQNEFDQYVDEVGWNEPTELPT